MYRKRVPGGGASRVGRAERQTRATASRARGMRRTSRVATPDFRILLPQHKPLGRPPLRRMGMRPNGGTRGVEPASTGHPGAVPRLLHQQLLVATGGLLRRDTGHVPVAGAMPLHRDVV
jgi:hypothetical protein